MAPRKKKVKDEPAPDEKDEKSEAPVQEAGVTDKAEAEEAEAEEAEAKQVEPEEDEEEEEDVEEAEEPAPQAEPVNSQDTPSVAPALMVSADSKLSPMDILRLAAKQEKQRRSYASAPAKLPGTVTLPSGIVIRNN